MPFLGNTPANTFVSIAKQTITGNGGTSYALSYPVTNGNEIDVFVNNVRQEPTAAYTASGSTITFTEAITVSDSVYVIFNGQAIGTIDAPAGAYLPTTGGTINGSVGVKVNADSGTPLLIGRVNTDTEGGEIAFTRASDNANAWAIDVYGNTSTPSLRIIDNIAGAVRLNIDGSGRVNMPYQPAIILDGSLNSTASYSAGQNWNDFSVVNSRGGMSWNSSNGRITVPVSGYYVVYAQLYMYSSSTGQYRMAITKNGSNVILSNSRQEFASAYETTAHISAMISCSANDYINLNINYARPYYAGNQHNHMYVALVG